MKNKNFSSIDNLINIAKKGGMYILVDDETSYSSFRCFTKKYKFYG